MNQEKEKSPNSEEKKEGIDLSACDIQDVVDIPGLDVGSIDAAMDETTETAAKSKKDKKKKEKKKEPTLAEQLAESQDRVLRLTAELENVRRRNSRELADMRKYDGLFLMREILPVLDNLYRAIDAAEKLAAQQEEDASTEHPLLEGCKMLASQLAAVLENNHCKKIEAVGQSFDPHLHEAILQQPSQEVPAGEIIMETQTGHILADRVIRPSQVIVSAGPGE